MGIIITVTTKIIVIPNTWPLALLSVPQRPQSPRGQGAGGLPGADRSWNSGLELGFTLSPNPPNPVLGTGPAPHL